MLKLRRKYLLYTIALFLIEVVIAMFIHDRFIRPFLGDFLVVIMLYCLLRSTVKIGLYPAGLVVLLFAFSLETLQYFHFADRLGIEHKIIRIVLGTSFSWYDMLAYTLGILTVLALESFNKNSNGN